MATEQPALGIRLADIQKVFGEHVVAVDDVSFDVREGEFFSLLGPSGCGKTTTLRIIAGLEQPTAGRIELRGRDITDTPPARRDVNMVFQAYALFPHMTVFENVAFGLRAKRTPRSEVRNRVGQALQTVRLEGMESRHPRELSGGQQQRVALARALVNRPAALLLDEPLGALDLKLRKQMQTELKMIQETSGTMFVYVTHDQEEALTMSDRIAVMNGGVVEQIAEPRALYEHPATSFVAGFIGTSNVIEFRCDRIEDEIGWMQLGEGDRIVACIPSTSQARPVEITVRPEKIQLLEARDEPPPDRSRVQGVVADVTYLGSMTELIVELPTRERLAVHRLSDAAAGAIRRGETVILSWASEHSFVIGSRERQADDPAGARQADGQ
jgi:spermidine/putrescine transport system ATP-binding protein